ncbi:hypothetical protein ACOMHN_001804 [Nucella lapillus]
MVCSTRVVSANSAVAISFLDVCCLLIVIIIFVCKAGNQTEDKKQPGPCVGSSKWSSQRTSDSVKYGKFQIGAKGYTKTKARATVKLPFVRGSSADGMLDLSLLKTCTDETDTCNKQAKTGREDYADHQAMLRWVTGMTYMQRTGPDVVQVRPVTRFLPDATRDPSKDLAHVGYRLATLSVLPPIVDVSRIKLADAGFYSRGERDEVICYSCGVRYSGWGPREDPMTVHRRLSPQCQHVLQRDRELRNLNVSSGDAGRTGGQQSQASRQTPALSASQGPGDRSVPQQQSQSRQQSSLTPGNVTVTSCSNNTTSGTTSSSGTAAVASTTGSSGRTTISSTTSSSGTTTIIDTSSSSGRTTSSNTSSSSGTATVASTTGSSGRTTSSNTTSSSGTTTVISTSSSSGTTTSISSASVRSSTVPVSSPPVTSGSSTASHSTRPLFPQPRLELGSAAHPSQYSFLGRRRTFTQWDKTRAPPLDEVVLSGFFYSGYTDCVACFYCGVRLKDWQQTDKVHVEHVRHSPHCGYIRDTKGEEFIRQIQRQIQASQQSSTNTTSPQFTANPSGRTSGSNPQPPNTGAGGQAGATAASPARPVSSAVMTSPAVTAPLTSPTVMTSPSGAAPLTSSSSTATSSQPNPAPAVPRREPQPPGGGDGGGGGVGTGPRCRVCHQRPVDTLTMPCGHLLLCGECARVTRVCPLCGARVLAVTRVYMQ